MRTTLTIDDSLQKELKERAHRSNKPFKVVLNEVIRLGLSIEKKTVARKPFVVKTFSSGFAPGVDETKLNQLLGEMDVEEYLRKAAKLEKTAGSE